jgi:hypothetical protein
MDKTEEVFAEFLDLLEDALRARRLKRLPRTLSRRDRAAMEALKEFLNSLPVESADA